MIARSGGDWPRPPRPLIRVNPPHPVVVDAQAQQRVYRSYFGDTYDFNSKPSDWDSYCKRKGYAAADSWPGESIHPVLVVVILRRPLKDIFPKGGDYPRRLGPHPIIYEYRMEAEGYALRSGDFLGAAQEGTLGGFLWNSRDLTYNAVSCAHVLGRESVGGKKNRAYSPKPGALGAKVEIGDVIWSQMPSASSTTKCNSRADPNAPTIDAACAVIDGNTAPNLAFPGAGKITQWTPIASMGQGDPTSFYGNISGHVHAKIKEATIWKEIKLNGTPYCFKDIFALEDTVFQYVAAALAKKGDSGAWVVNATAGVVSWDGMLVGGDGQNAYCCYAANIMSALATRREGCCGFLPMSGSKTWMAACLFYTRIVRW